MHLRRLTLPTRDLAAQHAFYARALGFEVEDEAPGRFTFRTGTSRLTFRQGDGAAGFSHLAWDIAPSQVEEAATWLRARLPLLADDTGATCFPPGGDWNTTNLYFEDPAGNILEFVARHHLRQEPVEPFGPRAVLHLSEFGLVVPDVAAAVHDLDGRFGLRPFNGRSDTFTPVGSHAGMFIVVPQGRGWFPAGRPAVPTPFQVTFADRMGTHTLNHLTPEASR